MSGYLSKPVDVLALHEALAAVRPGVAAGARWRSPEAGRVEALDRGRGQILSSARSRAEPS